MVVAHPDALIILWLPHGFLSDLRLAFICPQVGVTDISLKEQRVPVYTQILLILTLRSWAVKFEASMFPCHL